MTKLAPIGIFIPVITLALVVWLLKAATVPPAPPAPWPSELISTSAINPRTFGATGDGVHDDSDAIAAAIALSVSKGTNRGTLIRGCPPVFFPNGVYRIDKPRALTPVCPHGCSIDGFTLIGENYKGVVLHYLNTEDWLFKDVDLASSVVMQNLVIRGSNTVGMVGAVRLLYLSGNVGGRVFDLRLKDVDLGAAKELIRFEGVQVTSENKFDNLSLDVDPGCTGITWNNPQSVNQWFHNLSVGGSGTIFNILGGGMICVENLDATLRGNAVLIQVGPGSEALGPNNSGIFVSGARTELFSGAQLVKNTTDFLIAFRDSNFAVVDDPALPRVTGKVVFDSTCIAPPKSQ
jgi:hypothetical protein